MESWEGSVDTGQFWRNVEERVDPILFALAHEEYDSIASFRQRLTEYRIGRWGEETPPYPDGTARDRVSDLQGAEPEEGVLPGFKFMREFRTKFIPHYRPAKTMNYIAGQILKK
jgi:hypothetical protein